MISLSNWFLSW